MALLVDTLVRAKGLQPTTTFREDRVGGIVYSATNHRFSRVSPEELVTLRRLSRGEKVWLASSTYDKWARAGWLSTDAKLYPSSEKPSPTAEQPFRPLSTMLVATHRCNALCEFCCARPYMRSSNPKEFNSIEQVELLSQQLHNLGVLQCVISGGEPTLSPYLGVLLSTLIRYSIYPIVVSNGTVWKAEQYMMNDARSISWAFSYHSEDPSEHDAILKHRGAHRKVSEILRELSRAGIRPRANVVVGHFNLDRVERIIESLSYLGVGDVSLSQHLQMQRAKNKGLDPSYLSRRAEMITRWQAKGVNVSTGYRFRFLYETGPTLMQELFPSFKGGCCAGLYESLVFPNGSVHPCDYLWEEKFSVGNLFDKDGIQQITAYAIFSILHQLSPDNACLTCSYLKACKGGCPGVRYMLEGKLAYPNPECPLLEARN